MNLTQPPFDDLAVRRAMNWVMDRAALRKAWGGADRRPVAEHILPNAMLSGILDELPPVQDPERRGQRREGDAEMKKSKYAMTEGRLHREPVQERAADHWTSGRRTRQMLPVVQASAAKIGITFTVRQVNGAYPVIQTPSKNIPITTRPRWGKDYADPSTFIDPLFFGTTPPERQHELLARRADAGGGEEAEGHGQHRQRARASTPRP